MASANCGVGRELPDPVAVMQRETLATPHRGFMRVRY